MLYWEVKLAKLKLGRGIGAILEEVEEAYTNDIKSGSETITEIKIENIKPNPFQPRKNFDEQKLKELSDSIKEHGLLQPVVVIRKKNHFILIAGERRLRASKLAGLSTIRAIIADITFENIRELALIENIQRENLDPIELANSLNELIEKHKATHDKLAEIIHKSRTYVTNALRLLSLSKFTQEKISEGKLSSGHAKVLVGLDYNDEVKLVNSIINQKLSVRETEDLIKNFKNKSIQHEALPIMKKSLNLNELVNRLKNITKNIKTKNNSISIEFDSQESIDNFLKHIAG
ncbi:MAG: ParB family transcriptional regulator, chromosome partitioning protein [Campylobacterota bacterium]|nr:ParB family transcriptional regulator, chromosome partitioning protein [Campylobacterota bacterium]